MIKTSLLSLYDLSFAFPTNLHTLSSQAVL